MAKSKKSTNAKGSAGTNRNTKKPANKKKDEDAATKKAVNQNSTKQGNISKPDLNTKFKEVSAMAALSAAHDALSDFENEHEWQRSATRSAEYRSQVEDLKNTEEQAFFAVFPRLKRKSYTAKSNAQKRRLLENAYLDVLHEIEISKLVYRYHGCDSWEDMFRDNVPKLEEKLEGIRIALLSIVGIE